MIKDKQTRLTGVESLFTYTTIGRLVEVTSGALPRVELPDGKQRQTCSARSCIQLTANQLGCDVVLLITQDSTPVIMGVIEAEPVVEEETDSVLANNVVRVDGHTVNLQATESISLECGKAKIILTKEGKITIKGLSLLSRAKGANRIHGGSVTLN